MLCHVLFYSVVFFLYLEPLTAHTVGETKKQIDDVETGRWKSPLAPAESEQDVLQYTEVRLTRRIA